MTVQSRQLDVHSSEEGRFLIASRLRIMFLLRSHCHCGHFFSSNCRPTVRRVYGSWNTLCTSRVNVATLFKPIATHCALFLVTAAIWSHEWPSPSCACIQLYQHPVFDGQLQ